MIIGLIVVFLLVHVRTELNPGAPVERDPRIHGHAAPLRSARIALEAAAPGPTRKKPKPPAPFAYCHKTAPDITRRPVGPIGEATSQTTTG